MSNESNRHQVETKSLLLQRALLVQQIKQSQETIERSQDLLKRIDDLLAKINSMPVHGASD